MERIDNLLPDAGRAMSGSSASRRPQTEALKLDDKICPHCGRELQAEWVEFPPALQKKYDRPGEWYYHPCTPECEMKNDRREWELMRRDARVAALKERRGLSPRLWTTSRTGSRTRRKGGGSTSAATWGWGRRTSRSR